MLTKLTLERRYLCKQIIDPLLRVNGKKPDYEVSRIIPKSYDPMGGPAGVEALDQNADVTTPNAERQ